MNTKKLRQKILDLAIRGKLVPQSTGDVNIVKLGDVCKLSNGISKRKGENGASTVVLRLADLDDYAISFADVRAINLSEQEREQYRLNENDLLFVRVNGSKANVGKTYVYDNLIIEVAYCDHLIRGQLHSNVDAHYLRYIMRSSSCRADIDRLIVTTAGQNTISQGSLNSIEFPLPPLAEQRRIVAAIDSAFAVIDEIERNKTDLQAAVTSTKQKILSLAIQGRLVSQDLNDESAEYLLQRVVTEKASLISKVKSKSKKDSDTNRYILGRYTELPTGWVLTSLGELFNLQAGKFVVASNIAENNSCFKYPCYGGNGKRGYVENYNRNGKYPLIGRQGALCGNLNYASGCFYATEHAVVVETFAKTNPRWAFWFLKELNLNQYATATAQPGLSVNKINEVPIPLPPLAEQQRIVVSIETAFEQLDKVNDALVLNI
jgi:type I restriction enzyme S subunit